MSGCVFCEIPAGRAPASVVFRDEHRTASMDIQPVNPGHVLVVPKDHAASLADLPEDPETNVFRVGQRIASALHGSGLRCEGTNLLLADGEAAGREVFHVHLHVLPRFGGDGVEPSFGPNHGGQPDREDLDGLAGQVRNVL